MNSSNSREQQSSLFPIDAVITWVDGDDPRHRAKRMAYMTDKKENTLIDIAGETRYRQVGEIDYCIASINRFAPWIRKIFIVTDEQNPHAEEFIKSNFPDRQIPMEIVDHKTIFKGYEQYLPTFNSISIVNMLYRIPGLSEHFICFNDDLFLISPSTPEDFFSDGKPIANGYWHYTCTAQLIHYIRRRKNGHKAVTFRDSMMRASQVLGMHKFIRMVHTPHPLRRSLFEQIYNKYPDVLEYNICHRFRSEQQHSACALFYCYTVSHKESILTKKKNHYLYMSPAHKTFEEVDNYLSTADRNKNAMFCCFNSLDMANKKIVEYILNWLDNRIRVKRLNKKTSILTQVVINLIAEFSVDWSAAMVFCL